MGRWIPSRKHLARLARYAGLGVVTSALVAVVLSEVIVSGMREAGFADLEVRGALRVEVYRSVGVGRERRVVRSYGPAAYDFDPEMRSRMERLHAPAPMTRDTTWRPEGLGLLVRSDWIEEAIGLPFLSFFKWQEEFAALHGAISIRDPQGLNQVWPGQSFRGVPILPLWPGFIANTLCWGFAWFALLNLPGALRRASRRRRGLCETCGYDLSVSTGLCPECGTARTHCAIKTTTT